MDNSFENIRSCVRTKVHKFCFSAVQITDEKIGATKINDLHLTQNSHMPGVSTLEALVAQLKKCVDIQIELSGDQINNNPDLTVDDVAALIYAQTV